MFLPPSFVIDASRMGNDARYFNHSCKPNLECRKLISAFGHTTIFAKRAISQDEELELSINYSLETQESRPCLCNSASCSGQLRRLESPNPGFELAGPPPLESPVDSPLSDNEVKEVPSKLTQLLSSVAIRRIGLIIQSLDSQSWAVIRVELGELIQDLLDLIACWQRCR